MKTYVTVYFGTVLVAMLLVPIVSRLAKKYHLVDIPGPRKVHKDPVPRVGGVVLALTTFAFVLPVFFLNNDIGRSFRETQTEFTVLLVAAFFIFMMGLVDDVRPLLGRTKLLYLIAASLAICASGATIRSVSVGTWFELNTSYIAWPLAVLWIVMITACVNVIDGLDGLAAGIAAIVCGTIVLLALWTQQAAMAVLMLALLGSLTGFLFFNFSPARIFMGDSGSLFIGFMIGAGSLVCQTKTTALVGLALPFLALGIPILDTGVAVIRRCLIERRSIFSADRSHLHHRLLDLGLQQRTVVIIICAVTAISTSIGVFMLTATGVWSMWLLLLGLLVLFSMFTCLHGRRCHEALLALRRNLAMRREARAEKRGFEDIQIRMRESTCFDSWWETMCIMAEQMHFQSIGLWSWCDDHYAPVCGWNAPGGTFTTGKTTNLTLSLHVNEEKDWEIRARIRVGGYLERSGRQAMLLARLMDEFPPPEAEQETQAHDQSAGKMRRYTIKEKPEPSL